jgi:hypothetical protein
MPHSDVRFRLPPKSPSASHRWLLVFHLRNSASILPCIKTLPQNCSLASLLFPKSTFLGCALVLLYGLQMSPSRIVASFGCVVPPSQTQCTQTNSCTHQPSLLLDQHAPSLGACPLPCSFPCVDRLTPHGCVDGVIKPLQHAHVVMGRQVHSLGMRPSCLVVAQMQPNSPSTFVR